MSEIDKTPAVQIRFIELTSLPSVSLALLFGPADLRSATKAAHDSTAGSPPQQWGSWSGS